MSVSELLKQLISDHSLLGQFREAENAADNLLSKNPQDADAMVRMGVVKIFLSEYPQAIGYFRRAIDADPTFINSYEELALLLATAQDEQYRDVEESLRVVDAARPFGGVGAHVMAEIYHASGETERAITTLRRGLARGEGEPSIVKARIRELEAALEGDAGPEDAPPEPSDPGETSEPPGPEEETRTAAGDVPSEEG